MAQQSMSPDDSRMTMYYIMSIDHGMSSVCSIMLNLFIIGPHVMIFKREDITKTRLNLFLFVTFVGCLFFLLLMTLLIGLALIYEGNTIIIYTIRIVGPVGFLFANATLAYALRITNCAIL